MMPLSQSHLSYLDTCLRKYQYVFLDALLGPSTYEQHLTTQWGSQFHLLMQQQALDLPVGVLSQVNTGMSNSLAALEKAAPEVFSYLPESQVPNSQTEPSSQHGSVSFSQSEHRRTLEFNGFLLTVVYDLLVTSPSGIPNQPCEHLIKGQIFDWKTHQHPPKREWLQKDWQTRLYLYVLCETSDLSPEQIAMTYWFVRVGDQPDTPLIETVPLETSQISELQPDLSQPSCYRFSYTMTQHEQTRTDLRRLTHCLTEMMETSDFPKVDIKKGYCDRCPFNARCERVASSQIRPEGNGQDPAKIIKAARQLTAETVDEIPF